MANWLHTMRVIRGIQQIFPVVVFGENPQMVGFLEKDWTHANGNKCHTISVEDGSKRPQQTQRISWQEEGSFCK